MRLSKNMEDSILCYAFLIRINPFFPNNDRGQTTGKFLLNFYSNGHTLMAISSTDVKVRAALYNIIRKQPQRGKY